MLAQAVSVTLLQIKGDQTREHSTLESVCFNKLKLEVGDVI